MAKATPQEVVDFIQEQIKILNESINTNSSDIQSITNLLNRISLKCDICGRSFLFNQMTYYANNTLICNECVKRAEDEH